MTEEIKKGVLPENNHRHVERKKRSWGSVPTLFLVAGVIFWFGYQSGLEAANVSSQAPISLEDVRLKNDAQQKNSTIDFSLFWDVWNLLEKKYVEADKLDARVLFYGAIKGMLAATGDPYTTFFDPTENKKFGEDISGSFEGIGAELGIKNGILTIVAPLQGSPSEKAGLRSGDKIIKIDGTVAAEMDIEEAVDHIRGSKGSVVVLTIFREGDQDTRDISVTRDTINVKSVTLEFKENMAVIEITRFGDDTNKLFAEAINKVRTQKSQGLIIDLRNNPGGYLESSIVIASKLLPKDKVVVIEENGDKTQKKMLSRGGDLASAMETVVLINEGSASASEILAGALKDNRPDNVTLVGKKSFGKGSVQEFIDMPQGTAVKITVARWLTPNGTQINEQGINPDKEINLTNEDHEAQKDPQMEAALQILKEKLQIK
ncbi:MAG: Carboxyl-terminal protease [uncultured bacterium]|nr:MAG: Carboxyl-terminal protease [uncultured bacterium]